MIGSRCRRTAGDRHEACPRRSFAGCDWQNGHLFLVVRLGQLLRRLRPSEHVRTIGHSCTFGRSNGLSGRRLPHSQGAAGVTAITDALYRLVGLNPLDSRFSRRSRNAPMSSSNAWMRRRPNFVNSARGSSGFGRAHPATPLLLSW